MGGVLRGLISSMILVKEGEVVSLVKSTSSLSKVVNFNVIPYHIFFVRLIANLSFFLMIGSDIY